MKNGFASKPHPMIFAASLRAFLFGLTLYLGTTSARAADCLRYEPAHVAVTGTLFIREDFGPPNYGETLAIDSKERHAYIALDQSICTLSAPDRPAYKNIKTMQIVWSSFPHQWIGKHVRIDGTLFTAETGHHQSDVLIQVKRIQPK